VLGPHLVVRLVQFEAGFPEHRGIIICRFFWISCCTLGVAVAVRAIMGTLAKLSMITADFAVLGPEIGIYSMQWASSVT
jgi:hypothetical protein